MPPSRAFSGETQGYAFQVELGGMGMAGAVAGEVVVPDDPSVRLQVVAANRRRLFPGEVRQRQIGTRQQPLLDGLREACVDLI